MIRVAIAVAVQYLILLNVCQAEDRLTVRCSTLSWSCAQQVKTSQRDINWRAIFVRWLETYVWFGKHCFRIARAWGVLVMSCPLFPGSKREVNKNFEHLSAARNVIWAMWFPSFCFTVKLYGLISVFEPSQCPYISQPRDSAPTPQLRLRPHNNLVVINSRVTFPCQNYTPASSWVCILHQVKKKLVEIYQAALWSSDINMRCITRASFWFILGRCCILDFHYP